MISEKYFFQKRLGKLNMVFFMFMFTSFSHGQEYPQIIPPSPNASLFHLYGNHSVNNYTGNLKFEIPIHNIKIGRLNFPIILNYTGGSGIKVDQPASQVGLGWSLNNGGMISRVIYDVADDDNLGYLNTPEIADIIVDSNGKYIEHHQKFCQPLYDTQPDKYVVNCLGLNFEFYIDKNHNILTIPRNNIRITPVFQNQKIKSFEIIDEYGVKYNFSDMEYQQSGDIDKRFHTSSWLISSIKDLNMNNELLFKYDDYYYGDREQIATLFMFSENLNNVNSTFNQERFVSKKIKAKKLSRIVYEGGSVNFKYSDSLERTDITGEYFIKNIEVTDYNNNLVKGFKFRYNYFSKRLQLFKVNEYSDIGELPPYKFTYDESRQLPSKYSNGIDHWGFYNGANKDQSLEPKRYVKYTTSVNLPPTLTIWGSGDRETNSSISNLGALTEVLYPLGGKSKFYYENNTCIADKYPNKLKSQTHNFFNLEKENTQKTIKLNEFNNYPYCTFSFSAMKIRHNNAEYFPYYQIKLNNSLYRVIDFRTAKETDKSFFTDQVGDYTINIKYLDINGSELTYDDYVDPIIARFNWLEESTEVNKTIGGFRIKRVENYNENSLTSTIDYSYKTDDGNSSGKLITVPNYIGYAFPYLNGTDTHKGITRLVTPIITLQYNQGSHVVYTKVRKTFINTINSKKNGYRDFYYTYFDHNNYYSSDWYYAVERTPRGDAKLRVKEVSFPAPPAKNISYSRGLLKKYILYNFNKDTIYSKINDYQHFNFKIPDDNFKIKGLTIFSLDNNNPISTCYYFLSSGISFLNKSTESFYFPKKISKIKSYKRNLDFYEIPYEISIKNSNGEIEKTEIQYIINKEDNNLSVAEKRLKDRNSIYTTLKTKKYKSTTKLSEQNTEYANFGNFCLPSKVQASKGTQGLEDRLIYHDYDDKGNPIDVGKSGGSRVVYVWGYNKSYPIVKIEGVSTSYKSIDDKLKQLRGVNFTTLQRLSNEDTNLITEQNLRDSYKSLYTVLKSLYPTAQLTTYTYDPLIGVTSITDPREETIYYAYDDFNRLEYVRDSNKNILKEYKYNYKKQ